VGRLISLGSLPAFKKFLHQQLLAHNIFLTHQDTFLLVKFLVKFIQFGTLGIDTFCFDQYVKFAE
jgi:hypothetical protein